MKINRPTLLLFSVTVILTVYSCTYDYDDRKDFGGGLNCNNSALQGPLAIDIPPSFPRPIEFDRQNVHEEVELGRHLFYEKRLSANNSISCSSCHLQQNSFSDPRQFSVGIDGIAGGRNAMAIVNLAWNEDFFWDGRSKSLEQQAGMPIVDPIEMHSNFVDVIAKLEADDEYRCMFKAAYGDAIITEARIKSALAQFERTIISVDSKYDKFRRGEISALTQLELDGLNMFESEDPITGGHCLQHCHTVSVPQRRLFANNGLDSVITDSGFFDTGRPLFKVPNLRNVEFTAPYMHDGRFQTLEEVIEHYDSGVHPAFADGSMASFTSKPKWSDYQKRSLVAFLKTLSDPSVHTNPKFSDPN